MMPKRHKQAEDNVDSWLMSYADMITLLLAFFIIFISTSEPKKDRLAAATQGMKERFGTLSLESPLDGVYRDVAGIVSRSEADRNVSVQKTSRGMEIELASLALFPPGAAEVSAEALPMLQQIGQALQEGKLLSYRVIVEAHTSDIPPPEGSAFPSNWDLSAAQSARVARLLVEAGIEPARLRASAHAGTEPLAPNRDEEGNAIPENQEKNRRVMIRVEKE